MELAVLLFVIGIAVWTNGSLESIKAKGDDRFILREKRADSSLRTTIPGISSFFNGNLSGWGLEIC
jgi:hypothetical protein